MALDPDHRLVVYVVPGKRTAENTETLVRGFHRRTSGRLMALIITDEYAPYRGAILEAYDVTITPPRTGQRGRPRKSFKVPPAGRAYATVHKTRSKGPVVKVEQRIVFGTARAVGTALARSASSRAVNTAFIVRADRCRSYALCGRGSTPTELAPGYGVKRSDQSGIQISGPVGPRRLRVSTPPFPSMVVVTVAGVP